MRWPALYWSERGKAPGKDGAKRLADAVAGRLAVEIGDAVLARSLVEGKAAGYADPTRTEHFWVEVRDYLTQKCEPYFDCGPERRFRTGRGAWPHADRIAAAAEPGAMPGDRRLCEGNRAWELG